MRPAACPSAPPKSPSERPQDTGGLITGDNANDRGSVNVDVDVNANVDRNGGEAPGERVWLEGFGVVVELDVRSALRVYAEFMTDLDVPDPELFPDGDARRQVLKQPASAGCAVALGRPSGKRGE